MNTRSKVNIRVRVRVTVRRWSGRRELCTTIECFSNYYSYDHNNKVKVFPYIGGSDPGLKAVNMYVT